ncbi:RNA polymerase sigma factor [Sphingobacterium sp. LRF_L2]|uniref:RNA polymerase sigma factor n=1 Tax=Sphingobacterium sp. LRF_L2 TaxID=3369421 RepID=UPI003F5DC94C
MTTTDFDEKATLALLRDGDHLAFENIYQRHKRQLANSLFTLLRSGDMVEEIMQEVFVRIWESRNRIDIDKPIASYIYKVGTNLVFDYYRKVAKDEKLAQELWSKLSETLDSESLKIQLLADEELIRTIELLPPQRKLVFKLCKLEGKSYAEASKMLAVSEAAINDHITKANRFLLKNYNKSVVLTLLWIYNL